MPIMVESKLWQEGAPNVQVEMKKKVRAAHPPFPRNTATITRPLLRPSSSQAPALTLKTRRPAVVDTGGNSTSAGAKDKSESPDGDTHLDSHDPFHILRMVPRKQHIVCTVMT